MADEPTYEIIQAIIAMEAQLVVLRQLVTFLVVDRFSGLQDPEEMLRALSDGIARGLSRTAEAQGDPHLATERVLVELDKVVAEIRSALWRPSEPY